MNAPPPSAKKSSDQKTACFLCSSKDEKVNTFNLIHYMVKTFMKQPICIYNNVKKYVNSLNTYWKFGNTNNIN